MYLLTSYILLLTAFSCSSSNNNKIILNVFHLPFSLWKCDAFRTCCEVWTVPESPGWRRSSWKNSPRPDSPVLYISSVTGHLRSYSVFSHFNFLKNYFYSECEERKYNHLKLIVTKSREKTFWWEWKECD